MGRTPETFRRRLSLARLFALLGIGFAFPVGGCSFLHEVQNTHYETVQADAQHDTQLAEAEHAKAIEYFSGRSCGGCDFSKAEEHLQKALVADVTFGPAHNTLGMLYLKQRKLYLAAWEFEYANKLMPERFEPIYNLALVYEAADKLDRAIEYASMAFSLAPRNPDVLEILIRTRMRNGESIEEVKPLVKEVLFYETRPPWICWAKEQLSRAPETPSRKPAFPPPAPGEAPPPEPLLRQGSEPPAPQDAPPPKIARPILPGQATTSIGPLRPDLFLDVGQSDSQSVTKPDTPPNQPLLISTGPNAQSRQIRQDDLQPAGASQTTGPNSSSEGGPSLPNADTSGHATVAPEIPETP
jgi:Tfp pilus assembly protein PilF